MNFLFRLHRFELATHKGSYGIIILHDAISTSSRRHGGDYISLVIDTRLREASLDPYRDCEGRSQYSSTFAELFPADNPKKSIYSNITWASNLELNGLRDQARVICSYRTTVALYT